MVFFVEVYIQIELYRQKSEIILVLFMSKLNFVSSERSKPDNTFVFDLVPGLNKATFSALS